MKLNGNLNLSSIKIKPAAILPWLGKVRAYLIGASLILVFGYTAYVVNAALNVAPSESVAKGAGVSFDKTTLNSLKNLTNVPTTITQTSLGKTDPFGSN